MAKSTSFTLVTHRVFPTLADDLKKYLIEKNYQVFFIYHEFSSLPTRRSFLNEKASIDFRFLPDSLIYVKDIIFTLWWLLTEIRQTDIYVGYGAFNVLPALLTRKVLGIKKIVFYTIDLAPNRFNNTFLNWLYRQIDKICLKNADETWNISPRMAEGREKLWNFNRRDFPNQRVVPLGVWPVSSTPIKTSHEIFFSGQLLKKQGVQIVIQSIPEISKKVLDVKFRIIGGGEYKDQLVKLSRRLSLEKKVIFEGQFSVLQHSAEQLELMRSSGVAVAPYVPSKDNFSIYSDPAKLKTYLLAGLPIVLTNVTYNALDLQQKGCAKVVPYARHAFAQAITSILMNLKMQKKMKQAALNYIHEYDWNKIFNKNISRLLTS